MEKPAGYYDNERAEMISELPRPLGRVLDVGCGSGGAARPLREAGAQTITGIEVVPEVARRAAERYDRVEVGDATEVIRRMSSTFDTILCYDVLEHLPDPSQLLRDLTVRAAPGATLDVSMPNARHWTLMRDLVFRGTFGYTADGHRDDTHLRWYTRRDAIDLIEAAGWKVEASRPVAAFRRSKYLIVLTRGRATEFFAGQWAYRARRPITT